MTISHQEAHQEKNFEIEVMLEKVFRIIHEGVILHEYLTDKEYSTLAVTLKNISPPLRTLRISQCQDKPLTTYALSQLLRNNMTLEYFHLEANQVESDAIQAIASILKRNASLQSFTCSLINNELTTDDIASLADMLLENKSLKELNLYATGITAEKTKLLATALEKNPTLKKLNLASNEIFDEGAMAIANALSHNTNLTELNLSDCRIGNNGIKTLFSALKQNTTMQTITLCRLTTESIQSLSEMIMENKGLQKLNLPLYTSQFNIEQIQLLLDAVKKNNSLREINIRDDDGKLKNEINEIQQILTKNKETIVVQQPVEPPKEEAAPVKKEEPTTKK